MATAELSKLAYILSAALSQHHFLGFEIAQLELHHLMDFPGGSDGKVSAYNAEDPASIPGSGRSSGEGFSSTLAWKIPWMEEHGRLLSVGSQRVGHD